MVYLENSLLDQTVWIPKSVTNGNITSSPFITEAELEEALADYNPTDNFKTINGESIIGEGDIEIGMGDSVQWHQITTAGTKIAEVTIDSETTDVYVPEVDLSDYPTTEEVEAMITAGTSGFTTTGDVNTQISNSLIPYWTSAQTTGWVNDQHYLTEHQSLSAYSTTEEVEAMITAATSAFTTTGDVADMISAFTTTGDVQTQIDRSLLPYWTSSQTNSAIASATSAFTTSGDVEQQILTELEDYYTTAQTYSKGEVDDLITAATSGGVTTGQVQTQIDTSLIPYWTSAQTNSAITNAISGFVTSADVATQIASATSAFTTTGQVNSMITAATSGMATEQWVQNQGYLTEHQSLSAYSTTDEVENMITAATSGFTTSGDVNAQISTSLIPYWTSAQTNSAITSATENMATTGVVENMITATTSALTTSAQVQSQITSALTGYNPTNNFKTINNNSIIGTGDITIQGGGSNVSWNQITTAGTKIAEVTINSATTDVYAPSGGGGGGEQVVELTQAQYLALTAYSQNTTYVITDADYIDMDQYYTSGETNAAIQAATSGKQDSITTTANSSNRNFPLWNANGQITGKTGNNVSSVGFSVNGSNQTGILRDNSSSNLTGIYAPTAAGSNGNILRSTGSGAPSWASPATLNLVESTTLRNIVICSQTEYDNMSHDSNTIYLINS